MTSLVTFCLIVLVIDVTVGIIMLLCCNFVIYPFARRCHHHFTIFLALPFPRPHQVYVDVFPIAEVAALSYSQLLSVLSWCMPYFGLLFILAVIVSFMLSSLLVLLSFKGFRQRPRSG